MTDEAILTRECLLDELLAAFPEWQASYEELLRFGGGRSDEWPGVYTMFGLAFLPDLLEPLLADTIDGQPVVPTVKLALPPRGSSEAEAIVDRAFAFFERMAASADSEVRASLVTTIAPRLVDLPEIRALTAHRFGPQARALLVSTGDIR